MRLIEWSREHPLMSATALVVVFAALGYSTASLADGTASDALIVASTGLVFSAFLGGVVKLLIDDHQRRREQRAEQARFLAAMLSDLKSVYDRVERTRILVAAHRSARTYGNEMRDLIDATVQLRNVKRALDAGTSGLPDEARDKLTADVESMEDYLNRLVKEFQEHFKAISDQQRIYESSFESVLKTRGLDDPPPNPPPNEPWSALLRLDALQEFRGTDAPAYKTLFVAALDHASAILRQEVVRSRPE